uniref:V-type proton ATPase proteolipid subunit n=1 Tax=Cyclophora tenuis TaxID=216820 RepID=A0A7S1D611_CYCTE|eukprot:CAMPEP_0116562924 /NCGR_PEP_ID=MMETSP0397-20121206/12440_1 /TAXON_ID=216820 /ORGANISM="Cyclophora tenuis, Strain ECT3854" /LENGTH=212 /DNA_ID=CAMNT_0004089295 /DNA_START=27 /DNA_END=665 /DNA_ORIENTATION=+
MSTYSTPVTRGTEECPEWAPILGYAGVSLCIVLSNFGSAWGTWRAGVGICRMGIDYSKGIMKNIIPVVMAGVLGIYGLIVSVIIAQSISPPAATKSPRYSVYNAWAHLAAGLCCGVSCLAAGGTIGIIGEVGTQAFGIKAAGGRRWWDAGEDGDAQEMADLSAQEAMNTDAANKLYVGLLIMLIFAEALALYGLIVALILSQHTYYCGAGNE